MKRRSTVLWLNLLVIFAVFVLNYFYQKNGFDFTLKCVCSSAFAALGVINLLYALSKKRKPLPFYVAMCLGLVLAMLGDVIIGYSFILGAAIFALGHIFFVAAYCVERRLNAADLITSSVLFCGAAAFLLFCPLLHFEVPVFRWVCIVYALIISLMLCKAVCNYIKENTTANGVIAVSSALFFFSDLMLVLDWFIGSWDWTDNACMGTYYPALCFLAFSMFIKADNAK